MMTRFISQRTYIRLTGLLVLLAGLAWSIGTVQAVNKNDDHALKLTPSKPKIEAGSSITFTVFATNPDTGEIWDASRVAKFSTTDPTGQFSEATYTAGQVGTWTITAKLDSTSATTRIIVRPGPVDHLVVNPNSLPEVVGLTSRQQFSVKAYDSANTLLNNVAITWRVEGTIGTIDASGLFQATKIGEGRVIASAGSVVGSADVRVRAAAVDAPLPTPTLNANQASNQNANVNAGSILGTDVEVPATTDPDTSGSCWDVRWWGWLLVLLGSFAILYGYYRLIETKTELWIWIVPVLLATGALLLYFLTHCPSVAGWFPWVIIVGFLILTLFRPYRFVPKNGQSA